MQVVQTETQDQRRTHEDHLASYLDKLLRQAPDSSPASLPATERPDGSILPAESQRTSGQEAARHQEAGPRWNAQRAAPTAGGGARKPTQVPAGAATGLVKRRSVQAIRLRPRRRQEKPRSARQVAMTALVPVLAITLFVLVRRGADGPAAARAETAETATTPKVIATAADLEIDWERPPAYEFSGHDPMRIGPPVPAPDEGPSATVAPERESLDVKGVLYSDDRPAAVIGTRVVHEGEQVAGATVIAIDRDGVELERDGRRWRQTLSSVSVPPSLEMRQSPEEGS